MDTDYFLIKTIPSQTNNIIGNGVTTMLQIAMSVATALVHNNEQRYSLNQLVTVGGEQRLLSRLLETLMVV